MKKRRNITVGQIILNIILSGFALAAILPFILLIVASMTAEESLVSFGYQFFPSMLSLDSYAYLFGTTGDAVVRGYGITIFVTFVGTSVNLIIAPMMAYVLSRKDYRKRNFMTFMVFFTMLFNGGLVPQYLMWTQIFGIKNTMFALILPNLLISGFHVLLMKSFFTMNIHPALIEAAKIDGAHEVLIYRKIIIPLSMPVLATVGLMVGIAYWNDWQNGLYYITKPSLFSLQNMLNRILINIRLLSEFSQDVQVDVMVPSLSIRMAMAVIGSLPIMMFYPFFQKYFVKGISLGGVKG